MNGFEDPLGAFEDPKPGTWRWWIVTVMRTARTFLAMVGMIYVFRAPLTLNDVVGPFIIGSIAIHIYAGYRDWHRPNRRFA